LKKEIIPWFKLVTKTQLFQTWKSFNIVLEEEYGPSPFNCPRSTLLKLSKWLLRGIHIHSY